MNIPIEEVADAIDRPVWKWIGHCHEVSAEIVESGVLANYLRWDKNSPPKLRYGHWTGPVHPDSMFAGRPVVRHGWIEILSQTLPGGLIVDPTRFVFEDIKAYIYVGANDYYDVGGSRLRDSLRDQDPPRNDGKVQVWLPEDVEVMSFIQNKLAVREIAIGFNQLLWLANANPGELYPYGEAVYKWLDRTGNKALIPIDYWNLVMN